MAHQIRTAEAVVAEMRAQGIPVHIEPGWPYRGSSTFSPRGLVVHHTANGPGEYPSLRIVRDGRSGLPGPLSQWGLGRSGKVYLIAAGRANHAGAGGWRGLSGNTAVWGIEAESTGRGDWTPEQRRNYPRLAAALARHQPFSVDMICAHREWAPTRKPDPVGIDMPSFRAEVARLLAGQPAPTPAPIEEDDMDSRHFDLDPGESVRLSVEPADGFFGKTQSLLVLDVRTNDGEQPVWVWHQYTGGGAKGGPDGRVTVRGGQRFTRSVSGGWLDVRNDGTKPVFGALLTKRV